MKSQQSKKSIPKSKWLIMLLAFVLSVALVAWGVTYLREMSRNYAQETALPLEIALKNVGGIKECSSGDSGRGPDSRTPHYGSTFMLTISKDQAMAALQQIASQNGYSLTHASPSNRGPLGAVADEYIDNWYFDNTSKNSQYEDLTNGKITLSAVIYGEGAKDDCSHSVIPTGQSTIGIGIRLPEFKR